MCVCVCVCVSVCSCLCARVCVCMGCSSVPIQGRRAAEDAQLVSTRQIRARILTTLLRSSLISPRAEQRSTIKAPMSGAASCHDCRTRVISVHSLFVYVPVASQDLQAQGRHPVVLALLSRYYCVVLRSAAHERTPPKSPPFVTNLDRKFWIVLITSKACECCVLTLCRPLCLASSPAVCLPLRPWRVRRSQGHESRHIDPRTREFMVLF